MGSFDYGTFGYEQTGLLHTTTPQSGQAIFHPPIGFVFQFHISSKPHDFAAHCFPCFP